MELSGCLVEEQKVKSTSCQSFKLHLKRLGLFYKWRHDVTWEMSSQVNQSRLKIQSSIRGWEQKLELLTDVVTLDSPDILSLWEHRALRKEASKSSPQLEYRTQPRTCLRRICKVVLSFNGREGSEWSDVDLTFDLLLSLRRCGTWQDSSLQILWVDLGLFGQTFSGSRRF